MIKKDDFADILIFVELEKEVKKIENSSGEIKSSQRYLKF